MVITGQDTKVLIVGAGPSGLMMAAQLLRYGVQPLIIDSKQGPTTYSKALAVQARSLEMYRQMGVIDKVIANGKQAEGACFVTDGDQAASLSFQNVGENQTLFPYILMYQQSKNERLLLDYLTLNCCPVYWNTTLISLKQNSDGVEAGLETSTQQQTINCEWVIGADGAHSIVRQQTGISFAGNNYSQRFYLADVKINNDELTGDRVQLYLSKKGLTGFFPMPEEKFYRIIGNLPNQFDDDAEPEIKEILPFVKVVTGFDLSVQTINWFTTYKLHHRMAEKFRNGRCFLIGDAAHIHSPVGGQGMNTGLQDAYNLAWKLAAVINKQISETVLDSYATERMPLAKTLLSTTDRVFSLIMSNNWLVRLFTRNVMPKLLNFGWKNENIRSVFFKTVSQTGINYRGSSINLHLSNATQIKAGDRLPYLKVFDEKKQQETDLHEWCIKPGFTLIAFGKLQDFDLFGIAKWITDNYQPLLNFFYLPPSEKNQHIFNAFEIKAGQQKAVIIRPDMYIGFINDWIDMDKMDNYLRNVVCVI